MVVSVVTRGLSDDANGYSVDGNRVWLRISRMGGAMAFHASRDGQWWDLIRHFALDAGEAPLVGFVAQAPTGEGCEVRLDGIRFRGQRACASLALGSSFNSKVGDTRWRAAPDAGQCQTMDEEGSAWSTRRWSR